MSKAVLFTDIHWGKSKDAINKIDVINNFFEKFTEYVIQNKIKTAFFLGDFFDSRNSINVYTLCIAYDALRKLTEHLDNLYMIVGNHDCYFNNEKVYINSLKTFSHIENITVIDKNTSVVVDGKSFMMCPWGSIPTNSNYDYLLGHFHPNGTVYNNGEVVKDSSYSISNLIDMSNHVFSGHVHQHKINDFDGSKFTYVGSPYELDFGDADSEKGWIELNVESGKFEHIKNNFSPIHLKFYWSQILDKSNVPTKSIVENNYIKLIIDQKFEYDKLFKIIAYINGLKPATVAVEYVFNTSNVLLDNLNIDNTNSKKLSNLEYIKQYVEKLDTDGIDKDDLIKLLANCYSEVENTNEFASVGRINFEKITIQNFKSIGEKIEFNYSQTPGLVYVYGNNKDMKGQANAAGKCVSPDTKIQVQSYYSKTSKSWCEFNGVSSHNPNTTIGNVVEFYKKYKAHVGRLKVWTPYGYKKILAADQTDYSMPLTIKTKMGLELTCSENHRIKTEVNSIITDNIDYQYGFKSAKDLFIGSSILTNNGIDEIVEIVKSKESMPLYDLQVGDVEQYYTNDIISHNSTIFTDASLFPLFCKTLKNTNNEFIPNRLFTSSNLPTEVSLWFSIGSDKYNTISSIKKNSTAVNFKIFKNGEDVTKSTSMKSREYIEGVLQCEFDFFKNSIIVSSSDKYVFFEQGKQQRRQYIETLLKISVFGDMLKKVRENINSVSKDSLLLERDIRNTTQTLNEYKQKEASFVEDKFIKINGIKKSIEQKYIDIESIVDVLLPLSEKELLVVNSFDKIVNAKHAAISNVKDFKNKIELIKKDMQHNKQSYAKHEEVLSLVCEDCNALLLKHYNLDNLNEIESDLILKINEFEKKAVDGQLVVNRIESQYNTIQKLVKRSNDYNTEQMNKKNKLERLNADIERLNENLKSVESSNEMFSDLIAKHEDELQNKINLCKSFEKQKKHLMLAEHVVAEDGVKKFIIKDVIETINNIVKKYLLEVGAEFIVMFDETFDYKFLTKSGECEYSNLSKGERQRLIVATLFAFNDIISMDGIDSNVFVIDEILDDGLDESGIKAVCNILKTRCLEKKQTAYVISHRAELAESNYFDSVVEIVKENGMTKITSKI